MSKYLAIGLGVTGSLVLTAILVGAVLISPWILAGVQLVGIAFAGGMIGRIVWDITRIKESV